MTSTTTAPTLVTLRVSIKVRGTSRNRFRGMLGVKLGLGLGLEVGLGLGIRHGLWLGLGED